ncbi:MAG: DsbE family thiol:disulfide interchange protein [Pseudomonadota bacterium]
MRISASIVPLVLMAGVGVFLGAGLGRNPHVLPSMMIDRPLPDFDLPPIRSGDEGFRRGDIEGRIAMINVFASWCVSCRIEHPTLMSLAARRGTPIYGVDWKDRGEDGAAWLAAFGDPYAGVGEDRDSRLAIELGVTGAPETFIVDRSGRIRFKQIGPITDEVWKETIEPVIRALEEEAAS